MSSTQEAVNKTLKYASFFQLPLTDINLHHWLISPKPVPKKIIESDFSQKLSPADKKIIATAKKNTQKKQVLALMVVRLLKFFPTIKLVALTGSLAIDNAKKDDDIDLMIITSVNSLWLTRLCVIPLIGLLFKRRTPQISNLKSQISNTICINLWLDQSALAVPLNKRNLYTAHEVLQVKPIFDREGIYQKFILANSWTSGYLANAYAFATETFISPPKPPLKLRGGRGRYLRSRVLEFLGCLNSLCFRFQYLYMKKKITSETVTLHSAYFHPRNLANDLDRYLVDKRD